jgi:DNA-binding transcriptional LysR family regulator
VGRTLLVDIDLNLLPALDALLDEVSVTRAAARLKVSQSAASHALNRLRARFDDPLLVRQAGHMRLTPLGEMLAPRVREMMEGIEQLVTARTEFCAARSIRRFSILASDYSQVVALPILLKRLRTLAPGVDLSVRAVPDPERVLSEGDDALMIGPERQTVPTLIRQRLLTDRLVCIARRGHAALVEELSLDRYLEAHHILVSPRGLPGSMVDEALRQLGVERRVLLQVQHFLVAPMVVAESDLLLTIPERLAQRVAKCLDLVIASLPFATPPIDFVQLWHPRYQDDPAHAWLRSLIAETLQGPP